MQIAIDGPSGAGKSSIAHALAQRLGIRYLDTGAMYRAVGYQVLSLGVASKDEDAVIGVFGSMQIDICFNERKKQRVFVDGVDISDRIRSPEVSAAASDVATLPKLRVALVAYQKRLAQEGDVVMDGRDIGAVVLPNADYKFFVTASPHVRALRRRDQLLRSGKKCPDLDAIQRDLEERDLQDMTREAVPLMQAEDAVLIDTSSATLNESVEEMLAVMGR